MEDGLGRSTVGIIAKFKNLAIFTFPFDAKQDFAVRVGSLPAGPFWMNDRLLRF